MSTTTVTISLTFALTVTGCFTHAPLELGVLQKRAALDMRCENLATHPVVDDRTRVVRGCGQEAVYIHICQTWSTRFGAGEVNCTWHLDRGPTPFAPVLTSGRVPER